MIIAPISLLVIIALGGFLFLQSPQFGKSPTGKRLQRIKHSPNFKDGAFVNIHNTPMLAEDANYWGVMKRFIFKENNNVTPSITLPSIKTNLHELDSSKEVLIWFGHSSYFIQTNGKKILVDPVFCGHASPISFMVNAFKGTNTYGVEYWGFNPSSIQEMDWNEEIKLDSGFVVNSTSARHFSGRGIVRNKSLWVSYVIATPTLKLFVGGDSGFDTHFKEIGSTYGPFDLVILENGQYDNAWKYIHMLPDQVLQAAKELKAKRLFPVHSSKFALANHDWDTPLKTITTLNQGNDSIPLVTPIIGEVVDLNNTNQVFKQWWKNL